VCSLSSKHLAQRSDADYSSVYNVLNLCPDTNTDKDVRQGKGTFKPDTATGLEEKHTHIFKFFLGTIFDYQNQSKCSPQ